MARDSRHNGVNHAPWRSSQSSNSDPEDDPGNGKSSRPTSWPINIASAAVPHVVSVGLRAILGVTVALYILNQKHVLPRPLSAIVSKTLFWPSLPITASRRIGKWTTRIDDSVIIGGAPFGFLNYPDKLYKDYGVRGVINMCEEYRGPLRKYKDLGMEQLHLPTTDHFEPSVDDLMSAIAFIQRYTARGDSVYVHCRAGHGRSAAAVFAWLLYKDPNVNLEDLNMELRKQRNVRSTLWKQPNILKLQSRLIQKGRVLLDIEETGEAEEKDSADD